MKQQHNVKRLILAWIVGALAVLCTQQTNAQFTVPELKTQLAHASTDSLRSLLLAELGARYEGANNDSCFYFTNRALYLARRAHNAFATAHAMCELIELYTYHVKDNGKGLYWLNQAMTIAQANNDNQHLAECYRMLFINAHQQGGGKQKEFLDKAISYARRARYWKSLSSVYQGYALYYAETENNYQRAAQYTLLELELLANHNVDVWFTEGLDYCDMLDSLGRRKEAGLMAHQLLEAIPRLKKSEGELVYNNDRARLYIRLRRFREAEAILLAGIASEQQHHKPDTLHLYYYYNNLRETYTRLGNWKSAYVYAMKSSDNRLWLQHKRQSQDSELRMAELEGALEIEKREREITLLTVRQKQQWFLLAGTACISLLLISFVLIQHKYRQRLEHQKTELAQLNTTKDKLLAILSHDLRAPVAALNGYLMLHNWGALSQQEFAYSAQSLSIQLSSVQNVLENLLDWVVSQLGGMKPRAQRVLIATLVAEQVQLVMPTAQAKGVTLIEQIPAEEALFIDQYHLAVIVRNLLQNALKFTSRGGYIHIRYGACEQYQYLEIADTGVGISRADLDRLFTLGNQTSRPGTAQEKGTGLGLVLVDELVKANGGSVSIKSQEGAGTQVLLAFKKRPPEYSADQLIDL